MSPVLTAILFPDSSGTLNTVVLKSRFSRNAIML